MSASFPSVPGFLGPFSLKAFLEDFFALRLTFAAQASLPKASHTVSKPQQSSSARPHHVASANAVRAVTLPVNESFLVVMYVARNAPPPPPPATSLPLNDERGAFWHNTRTRQNSPSFPPKSTVHSRAMAGGRSWLLYTNAAHRPFTTVLLQHPWWLAFASLLGPAAIAFVELYCPVVLQLEAMAGGVQVLGPALKHSVPAALHPSTNAIIANAKTTAATPQERRGHKRRRGSVAVVPADIDLTDSQKRSQDKKPSRPRVTVVAQQAHRTQESPALKRQKKTAVVQTKKQPGPPSRKGTTWEATLPHTDVVRTRLYSTQATDSASACTDSDVGKEAHAQPIPASLLEVLWVGRHPRSFQCTVHAALPRWQAARARRLTRGCAPPGDEQLAAAATAAAPLCLPFCHVRHVFRWMTLEPLTHLGLQPRPKRTKISAFDVGGHLQRILSSVLDQCSRLDLRGAALKHLNYIETRFQRQQRGQEVSDIQRLAAPAEVVVAYLRTLLSTLQWPLAANSSGCRSSASHSSFWGAEEVGSTRVLDALCATLRVWLSTGHHAAFPVSRFLDCVPVAQLPWLSGFFTTPTAGSPSAAQHARRQRSQVQQRVWLQFVLFLTQDILPFLVRASFAVTWSSKNTHKLLFFPVSVWRRVVRCELRRTVSRGVEVRHGEGTTIGTGRLCRLSSPATIDSHVAAATLISHSGSPALLYAGVRFRPDGRKLRPIAVMRSASPRSVKAMTLGTPSPYSHPAAVLRLLAKVAETWVGATVPPSTLAALTEVRRSCSREAQQPLSQRHRFCLPASGRPPHKVALQDALRCLVSGVEDQRVRSGLPKLSNLSHQDEYAELRSFCEETRRCAVVEHGEGKETAASDPLVKTKERSAGHHPRLFLVRSDASRCYDNLPQARLLEEAQALLCHDAYCTLSFTVVYDAAAQPSHGSASTLRSTSASRTISSQALADGKLWRIPRGHIYWEEAEKKGKYGATTVGSAAAVDGTAVRELLSEHLQRHLIVLDGSLFEQRVGILQGSSVAMLLCDQLLAQDVDTSLSDILSEHAERSLLLRRVDDVLVATTSPVAAQRCLRAMQHGWPSVGYQSNPQKLTLSADEGNLVPWCGLLLDDTTLETSVEWRRMRPLLPSLVAADARKVQCGDGEPLFFTQRLLAVIQLRVPPTSLCHRINPPQRQLQTVYEAALLWSRLIVGKVQETLYAAHHRCTTVLLLRPLAACVARLRRLLHRHRKFLAARQSDCDVGDAEVRACVLTALHRTVQAKLRVLARTAARRAGARKERGRCRRDKQRGQRTNGKATAPPLRDNHHMKVRQAAHAPSNCRSSLRAFWWCAASQIEAQWRGCLVALERRGSTFAPPTREDRPVSALATSDLLRDVGPSSLHAHALRATEELFHHSDSDTPCLKKTC